jgi:hypothetical protein
MPWHANCTWSEHLGDFCVGWFEEVSPSDARAMFQRDIIQACDDLWTSRGQADTCTGQEVFSFRGIPCAVRADALIRHLLRVSVHSLVV